MNNCLDSFLKKLVRNFTLEEEHGVYYKYKKRRDNAMKKSLFYTMIIIVVLGACSSDDAEQPSGSETEEVAEQMNESESTEEGNDGDENVEVDDRIRAIQEKGEVEEYGGLEVTTFDINQTIFTDAGIEVKLLSFQHQIDLIFESENFNFFFEINNGQDDTIFVRVYDITMGGVVLEGASDYAYMEESIPLNFPDYEHSVSTISPEGEQSILDDHFQFHLQVKDGSYEDIINDIVTVDF